LIILSSKRIGTIYILFSTTKRSKDYTYLGAANVRSAIFGLRIEMKRERKVYRQNS
jgi:hypothetical protein